MDYLMVAMLGIAVLAIASVCYWFPRQFYYNEVNDGGAWITRRAYLWGRCFGRMVGDKIIMRPAFFVGGPHCHVDRALWTGASEEMPAYLSFWNATFDERIFVPYVSAQLIPTAEQRKLFPVKTMEDLRRTMRVTVWLRWLVVSVVIAFALGILWPLQRVGGSSVATVTLPTRNGHAVQLAAGERRPLITDGMGGKELYQATVDAVVDLGGGLQAIQLQGRGNSDVGGVLASASLHLKKGDRIIIRHAEVKIPNGYMWFTAWWVVTPQDAEGLVKAGFHLND